MLNFPSTGMAGKSLNFFFFGQGRQLQFGFYKEAASWEDHILVATQVTAYKGKQYPQKS